MEVLNVSDTILTSDEIVEATKRGIAKQKHILRQEADAPYIESVKSPEYLQLLIEEEANKIAFEKALDKLHNERKDNEYARN